MRRIHGFIGVVALFALLVGALPSLAEETITVTSIGVTNVRSGAGTSYTIIGRLFPDETVTANGRSSTDNDWLRIDYDGSEGWVSASVVSLNGDPTTLSVVTPSSAESTVGSTGVTVTIIDDTNIRIGAGTSYPSIDTAVADESFDITGRTDFDARIVCFGSTLIDIFTEEAPENVWLQINYNGFDAWVNYQVVSVTGDLCDVEVAEDSQNDDDDDFEAVVLIVTTSSVNLRASNYRNAEILAVIPYDTTLEADARDSGSDRLRVTYDGQTGWVSIAFVEIAAGSVDDLPVEQE